MNNDEAAELAARLAVYRQMKIAAAFLRDRLDEQPYLPGAVRKPTFLAQYDPQLRLDLDE